MSIPFDAKEWLRADGLKVGTILTIDNIAIPEIAALAGFDWLWVDAEHGQFDERSAAAACAVNAGRVPTFVRLPDQSPSSIKKFLEIGCDGIILPLVSSAAEVDQIAPAALYPPQGERSVGITRANGYGARFSECLQRRDFAIIVQIETVLGVRNADAIIGHSAVDAVIIGPFDLSGSFGIPGQIDAPQVEEAIRRVQLWCREHRKPCGIFAVNAEKAPEYRRAGFDLIAVGVDSSILLSGFKSLREAVRQSYDGESPGLR